MLLSNSKNILDIVNGYSSIEKIVDFKGVYTDTREYINDGLFIALEGDNFDGHNFAKSAEKAGAKLIIAQKKSTRLCQSLWSVIPKKLTNK